MDFRLNEDQQMYVDTVRRFVKNEILPNILQIDRSHEFPYGIISKAWELGILNLSVPREVKGFEIDAVSSALIIKELSYGDTGISTSAMCNDLANTVIAQHGSAKQQKEFLGPYVQAPLLASFCLTEPGAGSDNSSMSAFIARGADGKYVLNGAKCFITNASYASQFTVFCKVGKPTAQLLACCIVPAEEMFRDGKPNLPAKPRTELTAKGGGRIVLGKPEEKLGQHLSNTATVTFEDVVVDESQIIDSSTSSTCSTTRGPWSPPSAWGLPGGPSILPCSTRASASSSASESATCPWRGRRSWPCGRRWSWRSWLS